MFKIDVKLKKTEKITIGLSIPVAVFPLISLHWSDNILYLLYKLYDFLEKSSLVLALIGTIFILIFVIIKIIPSKKGQNFQDAVLITSIVLGIFSFCAAVIPQTISPKRLSNPSVQLIQQNGVLQAEDIKLFLDNIKIEPPKTLDFVESTGVKNSVDLKNALKNAKHKNRDIIILDYYNPLEFLEINSKELLNPNTLYIVTQPLNQNCIPDVNNVVLLSPNISDEIVAIVSSIPDSINLVQLYRSNDEIGKKAESLFLKLFPNASNRVVEFYDNKNIINFKPNPNAYLVWLDWCNSPDKILSNIKLCATPKIIIGSNSRKMNPNIEYQKHFIFFGESLNDYNSTLEANLMSAIKTIISTHIEKERPLNITETLAYSKEAMKENKFGFFTSSNNLIFKYTNLKTIKYD